MVGGGSFFPLLTQIGAMVLLISPEQIELESYASAQIEALEEGNRWLHSDDAGVSHESGKNAVMVVAFWEICTMVLLISPEQIELESCSFA